jgi:hypothetical protein
VTATVHTFAGPALPVLRLDEDNHRAYLGDRELIRVTTAIDEGLDVDKQFFTQDARERGSYIHEAVKLYHAGTLDETSILPSMAPFWNGYPKFLAESGFVAIHVEQPIYDEAYGYAGRDDLLGRLEITKAPFVDLIDIKTGSVPPTVGPQTMAYKRPLATAFPLIRRWALNLPGNHGYRLVPLNIRPDGLIDRDADKRDESIFLAALVVANWKRAQR